MFENYAESAVVKEVPLIKGEGGETLEEEAVFEMKGKEVRCFLPDFRLGEPVFHKDEECKLKLYLLWTLQERSDSKESSIKPLRKNSTEYSISGEIVGLKPDPESKVGGSVLVVDCGVFVIMPTPNKNWKKGDYVKAEGRLDARKVA